MANRSDQTIILTGGERTPSDALVGPFAVALYRGATTLGEVDASAPPPTGATRTVSRDQSQQALERIINVGQGVPVGGDVSGGSVIGSKGS